MKPTDRERKILITNKCTMTFKFRKWREKGESFLLQYRLKYRMRTLGPSPGYLGLSRYRYIEGRCLYQIMSAKN
jgi:hypothetical protein